MIAFFRLFWLLLSFVLVSLGISSCFTSDSCPYGYVQNATGDCVSVSDLDGDDGNGQVIDPCPEGWVLGPNGFCVQLTDGDSELDLDNNPDSDMAELEKDADTVVDGDSSPTYTACTKDTDCKQAELCQFIDNEGNGICYTKCILSGDCMVIDSDSFCSKEQRCVKGDAPENCSTDSSCEYGNVCHPSANCGKGKCFPECKQDNHCSTLYEGLVCENGDDDAEPSAITDYYCSGESRCEPGKVNDTSCTLDSECAVDKVCHYELNDGQGMCLSKCQYSSTCENYEENFICNTEQKCVADNSDFCSADRDCPYGQVCHQTISLCNVKCVNDSLCTPFGSNLWCNSLGFCDIAPTVEGCVDDTGCHYGNVCHDDVPNIYNPSRGTCMPYCTDSQDCVDRIGTPYWYCNALNECSPDETPDGDVDIDGDFDIDVLDPCDEDIICEAQHRRCFNNNGVAECGSCLAGYYENQGLCVEDQTCTHITNNGILTINVETANFRAIAKSGGSIYTDPTGNSAIYLRDNTSGSLFKVYDNISDGSSLEPVEVIKGSYNVWVQNALGQRKQVLEDVEVSQDVEIDVPFDFYKITVYLKKNGSAFPLLPSQYRGELLLYDATNRKSHVMGAIGDGSNAYTMNVFASTYSIIFSGYLSDNAYSNQYTTIISKDPVSSDRTYNIDLDTVTISGTIDLNGGIDGGEDDDFGQVWLINVTTNERFRFWPIDTLEEIEYSREVLSDFYYVSYKPQGVDGNRYLWWEENFRQWDATTSTEDIDINLIRFNGQVLHNSSALFELYDDEDDLYMNRGDIYLRDSETAEQFHLMNLGTTGEAAFDVWIPPATYDLYYEGKLIEDSYYQGSVYPSAEQSIVYQTDVDLTQNRNMNINLPVVNLSGSVNITFGGESLDFSTATDDVMTMRRSNSSDDVVIFRYNRIIGEGSYETLIFPGTYDLRFRGSSLLGVYQNNIIEKGIVVPSSDSTHNISIVTSTLGVTITAGDSNLYELLQSGAYDAADIRVSNEVTRLMGSNQIDENGRFVIERPTGDISLLLYLYKGNSYQIYPLLSKADWDFEGDEELSFDISPVTFAFKVLKNGETLPDTSGTYSRGNIFCDSDENWETELRFDLGKEGEAYDIQSVNEGVYDVNLSAYTGGAFTFSQWKYIGCINVSK